MICLFLPASLGLVGQILKGEGLALQLLAIAFLLFSLEQARMAIVDLEQIAAVRQQVKNKQGQNEEAQNEEAQSDPVQGDRLQPFYRVTVSTIALELLGFYMAAIWLGWGAVLVLLSQVWFNCLANIQLHPNSRSPIQPWGIPQRIPVLVADGIGLILVSLWMTNISALWMASGILSLAIVFGVVKYVMPLKQIS